MKNIACSAVLTICGIWFGGCAAPKSAAAKVIDCNSISIQEIETIMSARFLAPEVTKPELLGSDTAECNWFRQGKRGWVTLLSLSVSTRESRVKKDTVASGGLYLEFLRSFLVRNGQKIALGDGAWVNWVNIPGGMGNGVLIFRKQDTVVTLIVSDQDELTPNIKELTLLGQILVKKL